MGAGAQLFDRQASSYAEYRPDYPAELYKRILKFCDFSGKPWKALDIATGSGQAAVALADYFNQVLAIDSSTQQLKQAKPKDNVVYSKGLAEETGVESKSMDLITAAQAAHWHVLTLFDHAKFFAECARVLRPGGTLAYWGYALPQCRGYPEATDLIHDFAYSEDKLGPCWAAERRHIDDAYERIVPDSKYFHPSCRETVVSTVTWTLDTLIGYLSSWSAYTTWRHKYPNEDDLLIALKNDLETSFQATSGSFELTIDTDLFLTMAKSKA